MLVLEKDGIQYPLDYFRQAHPNVGFSGDVPPQAALSRYGFTLVEVPDPIPTLVTPRQARIALALQPATNPAFDTLLAQVEAAFASLPEPDKTVAQITWEYSTEVQRSNPLIAQMQAIISYTDEQIDDLFVLAAAL